MINKYLASFLFFAIAALTLNAQNTDSIGNNDAAWEAELQRGQLKDSTINQKFDYHFYEGIRLKLDTNYTGAVAQYERCLQLNPKSAAVYFELSQVYRLLKQYDLAHASLLKAIKLDPNNSYYSERQAINYTQIEAYNQAIAIFENLSKKYRGKDIYLYRLVDLYYRTNNTNKFLETIDRLELLHGVTEETSMARISVFNSLRRSKEVIEEINKLIRKYPQETQYQVLLAEYYISQYQLVKGLNTLNTILEKYPDDFYTSWALSDYYRSIELQDKSFYYFMHALKDKSVSVEEKMEKIEPYIVEFSEKKQIAKLDSIFQLLLNNYPTDAILYDEYATLLVSQERFQEAEELFLTATILEPTIEDYHYRLASIQIEHDSIAQLLNTATVAEMYFPNNPAWPYYRIIGLLHLEQQDTVLELVMQYKEFFREKDSLFMSDLFNFQSEVLSLKNEIDIEQKMVLYDSALVYNPKNFLVLNNYAYNLAICNRDLRRAERMSGIAVENNPQNVSYLDTYAWVFFMKGDYRSAKFYMERALNYEHSAVIIEHYGDVLFQMGEVDKAMEQWKKALEAEDNKSTTLAQKIAEQRYIPEASQCKTVEVVE